MDKTILDLATVLISGTSLLAAALPKFSSPHLRKSYFRENPYALKRDEIERITTRLFTGMAGIGIAVQFVKLAMLYDLPERNYETTTYGVLFGIAVIPMIILLLTVKTIGRWWAKKRWRPKIIENQRGGYEAAKFILEHDGWNKDQWDKRAVLAADKDRYVTANVNSVCEHLTQIEDLLECPASGHVEPQERVRRLAKFFEK